MVRAEGEGGIVSQDQICAHERMLDVHDYCPDCGELRTSWLLEGAKLRARIAELEAERDDLLRWKEDAVRLCAQRCCATRDARLIDAEARAEKAEAELAAARVDAEDVRAVVNELRGEAHEISGHANWVRIPRYVFGRLCVASGAMKIPSEAIDAARGPA